MYISNAVAKFAAEYLGVEHHKEHFNTSLKCQSRQGNVVLPDLPAVLTYYRVVLD